jgi:hypothetical protein
MAGVSEHGRGEALSTLMKVSIAPVTDRPVKGEFADGIGIRGLALWGVANLSGAPTLRGKFDGAG